MSSDECIKSVTEALLGLRIHALALGTGTTIAIDCEVSPDASAHSVVEISVWYCDWRLEQHGSPIISSVDGFIPDVAEEQLKLLVGKRILDFKLEGNACSIQLEHGVTFTTIPYLDEIDWPSVSTEQVVFFFSDGRSFSLYSEGTCSEDFQIVA